MAVTGSTKGDETFFLPMNTKPNYNIVGDNPIKKIFKIPVENIPDEEIEDHIRKVNKRIKKPDSTPDLDCGIYLPDEDKD
jgi:hypothetical protein